MIDSTKVAQGSFINEFEIGQKRVAGGDYLILEGGQLMDDLRLLELMKGARNCVREWANVQEGENILIYSDTSCYNDPLVIDAVALAAQEAGADVTVATCRQFEPRLEEPPKIMQEAILAADAVLFISPHFLNHSSSGRNLRWCLHSNRSRCCRCYGRSNMRCVFRTLWFRGVKHFVAEMMMGLQMSPIGFLAIMLFIVVIMGMFMETAAILMITVPVMTPVAVGLGIDLLWFGFLISLAVIIGMVTPPFGYVLFFMKGLGHKDLSMADIYRGILPFIPVTLTVLVLCIVFPEIALWLPRMMIG